MKPCFWCRAHLLVTHAVWRGYVCILIPLHHLYCYGNFGVVGKCHYSAIDSLIMFGVGHAFILCYALFVPGTRALWDSLWLSFTCLRAHLPVPECVLLLGMSSIRIKNNFLPTLLLMTAAMHHATILTWLLSQWLQSLVCIHTTLYWQSFVNFHSWDIFKYSPLALFNHVIKPSCGRWNALGD